MTAPFGDSNWTLTGDGKADGNDEENLALLPVAEGQVLTVDCNNATPTGLTNSELYHPATGKWDSAGSTINQLDDLNLAGMGTSEQGPNVLRPADNKYPGGSVIAFTGLGAYTGGGADMNSGLPITGKNAVYDLSSKTWTAGPDFPMVDGKIYNVADGPAALLPNGHVLVYAGPGYTNPGSHFFVFDGTTLTKHKDLPSGVDAGNPSYQGLMLVLPTGQIMFNSRAGDIELYTEASGVIAPNTAPIIVDVPHNLVAGNDYLLHGTQLNGVSQGAYYGDDYQSATNYPLVRIVFPDGNVFYARTHDHSKMSVKPGEDSTTHFTVPAGIETGDATLFVVADGIASKGVSVNVSD